MLRWVGKNDVFLDVNVYHELLDTAYEKGSFDANLTYFKNLNVKNERIKDLEQMVRDYEYDYLATNKKLKEILKQVEYLEKLNISPSLDYQNGYDNGKKQGVAEGLAMAKADCSSYTKIREAELNAFKVGKEEGLKEYQVELEEYQFELDSKIEEIVRLKKANVDLIQCNMKADEHIRKLEGSTQLIENSVEIYNNGYKAGKKFVCDNIRETINTKFLLHPMTDNSYCKGFVKAGEMVMEVVNKEGV